MSNYKEIWWEKTVEYAFVKRYVEIEDLIAPLAGKHEGVGDAIIGKVDKWLLIEFKKSRNEIKTEISKFGDLLKFANAKKELTLISGTEHHFIVYGEVTTLSPKHLVLKSQEYFGIDEIDIEVALSKGIDFETFDRYLATLLKLKNVNISSGDEGESGSSLFSRVVGVNKSGKVTECMSVDDYKLCVTKNLALRQEAKKTLESKQVRSFENMLKTNPPKP